MGSKQSKLARREAMDEKLRVFNNPAYDDCEEDDTDYVPVNPNSAEAVSPRRLNRSAGELEMARTLDWQTKLLEDPKNRLAIAALSGANPKDVLLSRRTKIADQQVFNVRIPLEGDPITNQRASGRCWLFASTNVFRVALMKKYNLASFELSQAYLFFWDKLEKANFFLENVIATTDMDLDSRLVQRLLADPVSDGGQWDMVYNLVDKYGLVPQALYPDSWSASSSATLNYVVVGKLREYALTLRKLIRGSGSGNGRERGGNRGGNGGNDSSYHYYTRMEASVLAEKERMMREIHGILVLALGPPPPASDKAFEWSFVDADGKARTVRKTPLDFARDIAVTIPGASSGIGSGFKISNEAIKSMVSLVHDPRHVRLSLMTVDRLGNVVGGRGVTYINVEMEVLKTACVAMLKAGLPVFFGCDVGKFSDRASGIMDLEVVDYALGFNVGMYATSLMDKAGRLRSGESAMTHAMVLTAVHVDDKSGRPVRWRVQNSWGEENGDKGWFVMSDAWMDQFVYQAVVNPVFLSKEVRDVLNQTPVVLPLWDPMGSLA
ncbi:peptidase C1-like family protein [Xylariaceae sp. FL0594]|nr:peptidase C1-like family protein [Xylariaceae sp. FL0594]